MKKVGIIISIIGSLIVAFIIWWFVFGNVEVKLQGEELVYASYKHDYQDAGFIITKNNNILDASQYNVSKSNNIDINNLGEYLYAYDIVYKGKTFHLERKVIVIDDEKPEIKVSHEKVIRDYCSKKDKEKFTFEVVDNYDGDLTNLATVEEMENAYQIKAIDSHNNINEVSIPIELTEKPKDIFKLNGNSTVYVGTNTKYSDSGVTYTDGCGNKITDKVTVSGSVDTSKNGEYILNYSVGNQKLTRKVIVYTPQASSDSTKNKEKIIYLTFDDGPCSYTSKVLDTLKKYNVQATFFVTHQFGSYVPLIKREYEEGHSVAVHTYTHNWNVYKSVDAYINDFKKMNEDIYKYTGNYSNIFRFPGGSSNTVSRSYAKGVVKAIASKMLSDGYQYFDWDVDSQDAAGASRSKIYSNVVNGVGKCSKCIVLMHDIKPNTVNELDNILNTLTSRGYKFGTLSINSPTVHHSIAN